MVKQVVVVEQDEINRNQLTESTALFNSDGLPYGSFKKTFYLSTEDLLNYNAESPNELMPPPGINRIYHIDSVWFEWELRNYLLATTKPVVLYGNVPEGDGVCVAGPLGAIRDLSKNPGSYLTFNIMNEPSTGSGDIASRSHMENKELTLLLLGVFEPLGNIVTSEVDAGGSGYEIGDTITLDDEIHDGGTILTVNTVDEDGAVLTYTSFMIRGLYRVDSYQQENSSGAGTGFQINVSSTDGVLDADLYVHITAHVEKLGG